jgi:membrane protein implicated in regulation of membrane protease activity
VASFDRQVDFATLICVATAAAPLIAQVVFGGTAATVTGVVAAAVLAILWFVPLRRRRQCPPADPV